MIRALAAAAALSLIATTALADEPPARIAPSLAAHTGEFAPAKVYEPAPGVFSAVGYGIANSIMVVGRSGVVIIDTTDSLEEAKKVWAEFAPRAGGKPVWDVVEAWLKSRPGGRVAPPRIDAPKLVGVDGNPGLGG